MHPQLLWEFGSRILPESQSGNLSVLCNDASLNTADLLPHQLTTVLSSHPALCRRSSCWAGKQAREEIQPDISSCSTGSCLHRLIKWSGMEAGMKGVGEVVKTLFQKSFSPLPFPLLTFCQPCPWKRCSKARESCRHRPGEQLRLKQRSWSWSHGLKKEQQHLLKDQWLWTISQLCGGGRGGTQTKALE